MNDNILILDCDGVIFDSLPLIDEYVQKINYKASDAYKNELDTEEIKAIFMKNKWEEERSNNPQELGAIKKRIISVQKKKQEHYEYKDMVLEEVRHEYENKIDYYNIYQLNNTFDGVINMIYTIYGKGLFKEIYVLSHVNCENEIKAKKNFFKKYLPMIKFIPVYFHLDNFYNNDGSINHDRLRTNKIEYFQKYTGINDLSRTYFIDDSISIIDEAKAIGLSNAYYKNKSISINDLLTKISFDAIGIVDNKNMYR